MRSGSPVRLRCKIFFSQKSSPIAPKRKNLAPWAEKRAPPPHHAGDPPERPSPSLSPATRFPPAKLAGSARTAPDLHTAHTSLVPRSSVGRASPNPSAHTPHTPQSPRFTPSLPPRSLHHASSEVDTSVLPRTKCNTPPATPLAIFVRWGGRREAISCRRYGIERALGTADLVIASSHVYVEDSDRKFSSAHQYSGRTWGLAPRSLGRTSCPWDEPAEQSAGEMSPILGVA